MMLGGIFHRFYDLVYKRTGFCWDSNMCTVTASEDRWAKWAAANLREYGLRKRGPHHFDLCIKMFSASVATYNIARSFAVPPLDTNDDDELDVRHPTMEPVNIFSIGAVNQYSRASRGVQRKGG
ncbi:hypothetical protein Sango_2806000 [Sesamum angolense]|uniref:Myb/SANT-like domain-containing protein n=1 Tax=Sesamum angolense TaxID=2727404 RepID=A0AAE1T7N3_9LAMI|nr:hypothetical protein Sango_2806000 [Sesamum angolense]